MKFSAAPVNKVRIIAGSLRGRRLEFPDRPGLRPTSERIRETLFNWLQADIAGARCLDIFAGSGALGIEALSRGASQVDFVDCDQRVCERLRDNLHKLAITGARVYHSRAQDWIRAQQKHVQRYDIVFLDPPYASASLPETATGLDNSGLLATPAMIYMEHSAALDDDSLPDRWSCLKAKKAGRVYYYLYGSSGLVAAGG